MATEQLPPPASMPHGASLEVVAALIFRQGRVLVQQRLAGAVLGAAWEFPGGKIEPGEGPTAALQRECREELGVEVAVGELCWDTTHRGPTRPIRLRLYRATMDPHSTPEPRQAQALAWRLPHDLADLTFCPADVAIVAALHCGTLGPHPKGLRKAATVSEATAATRAAPDSLPR